MAKVTLLAKTIGQDKFEKLNSEEIIAAVARHGKIKNDNGKLVKYLINHKHWSPLEFVNFTFGVVTSRAIGRQIIRHKSLSVQEFSQRYSEALSFEKFEIRKEHPTNRQSSTEVFNPMIGDLPANIVVSELLDEVNRVYLKLINAGVAKECARMILPECTTTYMTFNGNLRDWLSFLNVRLDHHAQKEIREIAQEIAKILKKEMPNVFNVIDIDKGMFM